MLEQDRIEHLHNHLGDNSGTVTMLAAMLLAIPYSISIHGPHIFFDGPHWALAEKTEHAKFIACIGHFCASQMMLLSKREHWHKLQIVRCGVDPETFEYREPTRAAKQLVYVGRLAGEKGLPVLFESLAMLTEQGLDLHLTLLGDGEVRGDLEALAKLTGIADRVTFAGFVDQPTIRQTLRDSDVFVLPSFAEGIPVSLMEAMAIGIPVIATYVGGVPELVVDGETGLVVHPSDPMSLADAIARYASDAELCRHVSRRGREKVEREFRIDDQVDRLAELFAGSQLSQPIRSQSERGSPS
jgi:glycosyltransferase involved in cell wall biosynthesis